MARLERISVEETRQQVVSGRAILACAYDDETKWSQFRLGGAIPLSQLRSRLPKLPKEQEIIFYCA